ncbi:MULTISPECIES: dihydrodipicolinate synthase family protein [Pseudomonas]|uniref:Dihydrodipicolinate synthase family protein n=2 Tax=Pseudomonas TaxID=286 RepID=A0ACD4XZ68_PSEFL|nr:MULTISPECIES: dihydrodipicolinate synthase family protein [Pseudomonas]MBZ6454900.1 dihydrodipicolinate synthase family protein [Pseudomonas fluorescens group sp.]MBZ6462088.1 dihydrodipicolinate synthase family protein [Pseudomonas fluorescens group sp.]MBZ6467384.1 dihydrodipicolinate synthase family protein [Pseudomonas fluorescens group sp.]QUE92625.1 dihydrodipicolinate synthase family protein [Pseudomonas sp. SCA2728.1_7]RMQ40372.1 putative dihydrodipicolinate synthase [Pseudomonas ci
MASYSRNEAREWAREHLVGVANVTIPTVTSDFKHLNEKAIRHDIQTSIAHGFVGTLSCSEVAITMDEYEQFVRIAVDEAAGRLFVVHHAVFNTLEDNIEAVRRAEAAGAELVLLGYPPYFHPRSLEEIYTYTKAMCDATKLAVMLFPIPTWGFSRLDPSDLPVSLLRRLIDDCPNVAAIKAEGGAPNIMAAIEVHRAFHKEVVISSPMEHEYIPLAQLIPIPFCGTNFSAYYGPVLPQVHRLIQEGRFDEATAIFHRIDPARKAFASVPQAGGGLINRALWKYESWLQGYNGGPLRHPTGRVYARDMAALRRGQEAAGLNPTADPDADFFVGRNPA